MKLAGRTATVVALGLALAACGGGSDEAGGDRPGTAGPASGRGGAGGPGGAWGQASEGATAAVPVEVAAVKRQSVASYIQTNGSLEAENDVEILARAQGPIVELLTEEGRRVEKGQVMARIDPKEAQAQVQIAEVTLREADRAFQRAKETFEEQLISQADYDAALAARESAEATLTDRQVQLDYTEIRAPFGAVVVDRAVKLGDTVSPNQVLFRISDFDPLLCKIQVPEKELPRLHKDQPAYLTVEAWPERRFPARVLRLSPVVDSTTGTIRVTLEVEAQDKLRPGMFASVYLEVDRHEDALTIPKSALSLESLGDTVYVINGDVAARRPVQLGFEEADIVEVASGLEESDRVIVVGQDGLSDGTPVRILEGPGSERTAPLQARSGGPSGAGEGGQWPGSRTSRGEGSEARGGDTASAGAAARAPATGAGSPSRANGATPAGVPEGAAQARGPQPGGWGGGPPAQMLEACQDKKEGDDCSFASPRGDDREGSCRPRRDDPKQLVCLPSGGWGGPPGSGPSGGGGR